MGPDMQKREYQDKKIYEFKTGDVIFAVGESVRFFGMIAEGEVVARTACGTIVMSAGDMMGISDIWLGTYSYDYVVSADCKVCMYAFSGAALMKPIFGGEKKYLSVSVLSAIRFYKQQSVLQNRWYQRSKRAYGKLKVSYEKYKNYSQKYNVKCKELEDIESLESDYISYTPNFYSEEVAAELALLNLEQVSGFFGNAP